MTGNIVARRYARALFALGRKHGLAELEKLAADLVDFRDAVGASPVLKQLYKSPLFSTAEKLKVTEKVLTLLGANSSTQNFCRLLTERNRLANLSAIVEIFGGFLDAEKGIIRGEVVTAVELDGDKRKKVLEQLEERAGRALELTYAVDASILGGVLLKIGDQVLDASLRAQLSILKDNIKRGE